MSGSAASSSLRKRPISSSLAIGSMCERPGQVTDDRRDAGAAPAPRRQQRPGGVRTTHLDGDLPGQLQHVVVQQEETGKVQLLDDPQLLLQAGAGGVQTVRPAA